MIEELTSALGLCKNLSPGMDNVRFAHIRCLPESVLEFLPGLYNDSLISLNSQTPVDWKRTRIVTVLKPGTDPALADSYRPISLLSCIRKLFEQKLLVRLELWAEKSEILSGTLFSCREGKGTTVLSADHRSQNRFHLKVLAAIVGHHKGRMTMS
jgi:hypothetical protein